MGGFFDGINCIRCFSRVTKATKVTLLILLIKNGYPSMIYRGNQG
jgi:hypothetical protein